MADFHHRIRQWLMGGLIILVMLCANAEARGIEAGLWGIGWDSPATEIQTVLENQGFAAAGRGEEGDGLIWQEYSGGQYADFPYRIRMFWQGENLRRISLESAEAFLLGTDFPYRNLTAKFTQQFGPPQGGDAYMLKIFPGIWVEWARWTVTDQGSPPYTVTLSRQKPAYPHQDDPDKPAKISILFERNANIIR